jgi:hypothetical protein
MSAEFLPVLLFLAAVLYTSVGHAGASGYLAAMAACDLAVGETKPAALVLNLIAVVPTVTQFAAAGHFDRRLFVPLVLGSAPLAFVGGGQTLPARVYHLLLGSALLLAAVRLALPLARDAACRRLPAWGGVLLGAGIGYLSGLTGVGGGIYLTPVLLLAGLAATKPAAGVSAGFILVNSLAGLGGHLSAGKPVPAALWQWCLAVVLGSLIGSTLGSRVFGSPTLRRVLAGVLLVAAGKLALG